MHVDASEDTSVNSSAKSVRAVLTQLSNGTEQPNSRFANVEEAAKAFGMSRETIRRMAHQRRIPALIGGSGSQAKISIPRAFIDRVIAEVESGRTVVIAEAAAEWASASAKVA